MEGGLLVEGVGAWLQGVRSEGERKAESLLADVGTVAGLAGVSGAVFEMLGGFHFQGVERWEEQSRGVTGGVVELWDMFYRGRVRRRLEELLSRQVEEGWGS